MSTGPARGLRLEWVDPGSIRYAEAVDVRWEALYAPWGLPRSLVAETPGVSYDHVVAVEDDVVVGYARLHLGPGAKVFQVSVAEACRCRGVGTALMEAVTARARDAGYDELVLDAREYAVGFYERLGWTAEGELFLSGRTGTPHRVMRLRLR